MASAIIIAALSESIRNAILNSCLAVISVAIQPGKIVSSLKNNNVDDMDLIFEFSFRERQPADSNVIPHLIESANYWRSYISE